MTPGIHLDLDGAWDVARLAALLPELPTADLREWGPRLRFTAPREAMEAFYREATPRLRPFLLFGSGDFHHLAALWLRRHREPVHVVSFDNHPDWDIRPPHWCCGSWISRALAQPNLTGVDVWGCGNFELEWPNRLFANQEGLRSGRLVVHPWEERLQPATRPRWPGMTRENWRAQFDQWLCELGERNVYITVDLDCLSREAVLTNWENGLFEPDDLCWALAQLHQRTRVVGGDLCGGWSPQKYARWRQRIAARFDHPRLPAFDLEAEQARNHLTLARLWPMLTGQALDLPLEEAIA